MKVLFLVPSYLSLYDPIEKELQRQGHEVVICFDENLMCDPYIRVHGIINKIKQVYHKIKFYKQKRYTLYWEHKINTVAQLDSFFDLLLVINGCSFHNCLLKRLKYHNSQIKSVLYLWDSSRYYDYYRSKKSFDKIFTFDYCDSIKYNAAYLPFYWVDDTKDNDHTIKYKMSIVGSNHDNRFTIVSKVVSQFKDLGYNNLYCKLYVEKRDLREEERVEYNVLRDSGKNNDLLRDYDFILGKKESNLIINKSISLQETLRIMRQSEIILDTDRETQSGATPRVIWALAMGKRIISTNRNLRKMPFYDSNIISIVDRNNPMLDIEFITKRESHYDVSNYIQNLRIDKWVKNFIE